MSTIKSFFFILLVIGMVSCGSSGTTTTETPTSPNPNPTGPTDPDPEPVDPTPVSQRYFGVNLAGAEFGTALPGTYGIDYIYPNQSEVDYFASRDMNTIRLPFSWERLQPIMNEAFDGSELERLEGFVETTTAKGHYVILDPHNYARYYGNLIGSEQVPYSAFADFWGKLATIFIDNPRVIFGVMNEPYAMPTEQWRIAANAAIAAIRETGAQHLLLVTGNGYSGGHSWLENYYSEGDANTNQVGPNGYRVGSNAEEMLNIIDPGNNFAFDVHQYLDQDYSGTNDTCQSETIGSEKLQEITAWLRNHNKQALLSEFGADDNATCLAALSDITLFIHNTPEQWIGWTYWAAGPWWSLDGLNVIEPLNLESDNPVDRPQMEAIRPNIP